ncbi:MAG: hypothetical protein C0481_02835 [Phenylobacterium sp.]|uniref:hypothetical protein n=1 Tax=Phenylobacterium sp. TaxID=1871053 RepID=UPI0025D01195|nr:hypothetical protein [Phenylobacterium sp.]MBA4010780.1 hypothetical protein [Phenylobacterium sp.]
MNVRLIVAVAMVLAIGAALVAGRRYLGGLQADRVELGACRNLAAGRAPVLPQRCGPQLVAAVERGLAAAACDQALDAEARTAGAGGYQIGRACSAAVKRLDAQRQAASGSLVDAEKEVGRLRGRQEIDTAEAVARAVAIERKKANANAAIDAAPRSADGRAVCDLECVRALAGFGAAPG